MKINQDPKTQQNERSASKPSQDLSNLTVPEEEQQILNQDGSRQSNATAHVLPGKNLDEEGEGYREIGVDDIFDNFGQFSHSYSRFLVPNKTRLEISTKGGVRPILHSSDKKFEEKIQFTKLLGELSSEFKDQLQTQTKKIGNDGGSDLDCTIRKLRLITQGLQIDSRYLPKITLENAGTQSIEFRNYLRKFNRSQSFWLEKYSGTVPGSKNLTLHLLDFLQQWISVGFYPLTYGIQTSAQKDFYQIFVELSKSFVELLELGLVSRNECSLLLDHLQSAVQMLEHELPTITDPFPELEQNDLLTLNPNPEPQSKQNSYLAFAKGYLTELTRTRCKILAQTWLLIVDETNLTPNKLSSNSKLKNNNIDYQRLIGSQIGLFKLLQNCMDKNQKFAIPDNLGKYSGQEQLIKEFAEQFQNYHTLDSIYVHLDKKSYNQSELIQARISIDVQDIVNYHLTLMLRITGVGASHFLLENLCYSNNFYSKFAGQGEEKMKTFQEASLKPLVSLREKLESELYKLERKPKEPVNFKSIKNILEENLICQENLQVDQLIEKQVAIVFSGIPKVIMAILQLAVTNPDGLYQEMVLILDFLVNICQNNPLAISQILNEEFKDTRKSLQCSCPLEWSMAWLRILNRSENDEIFSMGIHQWIQLSTYLVSLQGYSLGEFLPRDSPTSDYREHYQKSLHSILMAQVYKQLLIKGKNCKEQIWLKFELLKKGKKNTQISELIQNEILSLEQKFENVYLGYESIILDKINSVYFFKNWEVVFLNAMTWEKEYLGEYPTFDPWRLSRVDTFSKLKTEILVVDNWIMSPSSPSNQSYGEESQHILKSLAISIASDSTRMLSFYQYGFGARRIFEYFLGKINTVPEDYLYLDIMVDLLIHLINNVLDSEWIVSALYSQNHIRFKIKKAGNDTYHDNNFTPKLEQILKKYEVQTTLPFAINYLYGTQFHSYEEVSWIFISLISDEEYLEFQKKYTQEEELQEIFLSKIREILEAFIRQNYAYVLEKSEPSSDVRDGCVDFFSQTFEDQTKWHYNHVPFLPNWINYDDEKDLCKKLLMDRRFHRESVLSDRREELFASVISPVYFKLICDQIESLRKIFSEDGNHPAKEYFKTNQSHLSVYLQRLLQINLDCYTHDHRLFTLSTIEKNLDTAEPNWMQILNIKQFGILNECVEGNLLEVRSKEIALFDPQLYRRLLADVITNVKDSRLVLFVLAFPTHQLAQDAYSKSLLKQRERYLVENIEKVSQYFNLASENSLTQEGESSNNMARKRPKDLAKMVQRPIFDYTVSIELLQHQKQEFNIIVFSEEDEVDDEKENEYKKSFEIRLLERALIEDNKKYIKRFTKVIGTEERDSYLKTQVDRFIERNTYNSKGANEQKIIMCGIDSQKIDRRSIWHKISPKYDCKFVQELVAYQQELQLINEFFEGADLRFEILDQFRQLQLFQENESILPISQIKESSLYIDWDFLLSKKLDQVASPNVAGLDTEEADKPFSLNEISTRKIAENCSGSYLKGSVSLVQKAKQITIDSLALMINLVQKGGDGEEDAAALSMMFDFDLVFNQKTEELLTYGLGIKEKDRRAKLKSTDILKAYQKNFESDFTKNLWIKFRVCFQIVELILRIRDRVLNKSKMKPILNGLFLVQKHSQNLQNLECKIDQAEIPKSKLTPQAVENLKFICEVFKVVEVSVEDDSYYSKNTEGLTKRKNVLSYYFMHPEAFYLEETSKEIFLQTFDVDNPRYEIVKNMVVFGKEMSLNSKFAHRHWILYTVFTNDKMWWLKIICWIIGLVLNAIILVTYILADEILTSEASEGQKKIVRHLTGENWEVAINIASYIFAFVNFVLTVLWFCFKWNIEKKINREKYFVKHPSIEKDDLNWSKKFSLDVNKSILRSNYVLSFALHMVFALLGALLNPFFHTLHLLLWFNISEAAQYILSATTKRINTLFQTLIVTLFLIYSYSTLTANYYSDKFNDDFGQIDVCNSLASCFAYSMNVGLRNGGGIADSMKPYEYGKDTKFGWKIVFDLTYFIIINTIILNIVFGIIVDTFGDMRDEQFRRKEIVENTCLVCLNDKKSILETKNEFDDHIKYQHNIWDYVYFLNYLKHKPFKDLTIPEMEAWESTRKKLHDWLPPKKSMFLKKIRLDEDQQEDELMINMLSEINQKSNKLKNGILGNSRKIDDFNKNILSVAEKFNSGVILKHEQSLLEAGETQNKNPDEPQPNNGNGDFNDDSSIESTNRKSEGKIQKLASDKVFAKNDAVVLPEIRALDTRLNEIESVLKERHNEIESLLKERHNEIESLLKERVKVESDINAKLEENALNQKRILATLQNMLLQDKESSVSLIGIN